MFPSMSSRFRLGSVCTVALLSILSACQRGPKAVDTLAVRADSIRRDSIARARQDSINRTLPGYVVDSILPIEEEVRRFKSRVQGAPVDTLLHASASREALVRRIVRDVAQRDSV